MKTNAELPQDEAARLKKLRDGGEQDELRARVLALRKKKWPLRAVGEATGVTRVAVREWQLAAEREPELVKRAEELKNDVPGLPLMARGTGVRVKRVYPQVTESDAKKLKELAEKVRNIRGATPQDHPSRVAAKEYVELIDLLVNTRGIPAQYVARAAGVTRRAIVARLERFEQEREKESA